MTSIILHRVRWRSMGRPGLDQKYLYLATFLLKSDIRNEGSIAIVKIFDFNFLKNVILYYNCYQRATHKWVFCLDLLYILTRHIDQLRNKPLSHSYFNARLSECNTILQFLLESNSQVGILFGFTLYINQTHIPTQKQTSLSFIFQSKTLRM